MHNSALENAIFKLNDEVSLERADTPEALREVQKLRYQVYCVDRDFLVGQNGVEYDEYDEYSLHAIARWKRTGEAIGTVRLILPKTPPGDDDFPLQHVCGPAVLRGLPRATIGEVSRFALAKEAAKNADGISAETRSLLRLALIRGAVWLSAEAGHTHWLAVMEPTLLRLLRATGIHFAPLGPAVEYHGLRQPAVAELVPTMARLAREQPVVWEYITRCGTWYPAPAATSRVPEALAA